MTSSLKLLIIVEGKSRVTATQSMIFLTIVWQAIFVKLTTNLI